MSQAKVDIQNIPIDIHANKLCDWLISRHHCGKDWPEKVAAVRQKINGAIKDMPENPIIAKILLGANPLNYFHCAKIVAVLKETEADTKNIFGMYGSQRMKDWQDILKCYQKDNLYLSEGGSILARNVTYEIPALKRLVTKADQMTVECQKKQGSCRKQAQEYRDKFLQRCTQLGLHFAEFDAKNPNSNPPSAAYIGNQLVKLMNKELPDIFEKITSKAKDLNGPTSFYVRFLKSTIGLSKEQEQDCLALLRLVVDKGNVTTYQYKHGEEPLKTEYPAVDFVFEEEQGDGDTGAVLDLDLDDGVIDFNGLDLSAGDDVHLETGEIDWGGVEGVEEEDGGQIDFSIDAVTTAGIVLEEDGLEGGVARGEDALSILENPETRNFFIDELLELEGFLAQRLEEIKNENPNEVMLSAQRESMSAEEIGRYLSQCTQTLAMFNETKTKQFLLVRESKRYIIRLSDSLLQNLTLATKLDYTAETTVDKAAQLAEEIEQVKPKIASLIKQTRELQNDIAKEISLKYNNRQVYITGGV